MTAAFPDASFRATLLAELRSPLPMGPPLLMRHAPPTPEDLHCFAEASGLAPGFILLIHGLNQGEIASPFLPDLLATLPVGSDTRGLPLRWLQKVWHDLAKGADDPALAAAVDVIFTLSERASGGGSVSREEWRQARTATRSLSDPDARRLAGIVGAIAWDPGEVSGIHVDALVMCLGLVEHLTHTEMGWTKDHEALYELHENTMRQQAIDHVASLPGVSREEADEAYERAKEDYRARHIPNLPRRDQLQWAAADSFLAKARSSMITVAQERTAGSAT